MTKWDRWLESQNETTQTYFKERMKEDNPLIFGSMGFGFVFGFMVGMIIFVG